MPRSSVVRCTGIGSRDSQVGRKRLVPMYLKLIGNEERSSVTLSAVEKVMTYAISTIPYVGFCRPSGVELDRDGRLWFHQVRCARLGDCNAA